MARHAHTCNCCGETVWCHAFVVRDEGFSYCRNYPLEMDGRDAVVICEDCWHRQREEADLAERVDAEMHDDLMGDVR